MIIEPSGIHRCILCRREFQVEELTDEHAIPYALGGHLKLKKATCEVCRNITSKFETKILKGPFHAFRLTVGVQSRSANAPISLPIFAVNGIEGERMDIPFDQYPAMLTLPRFRGAALLDNGRINAAPINPWSAVDWVTAEKLLDDFEIQSFASISIDVYAFAKIVAKIAHCWAISEIGTSFAPSLCDVIVSGMDDNYRKYIRSRDNSPPANLGRELKHSFSMSEVRVAEVTLLVVHVTLFCNLGAPTYDVVVGEKGGNYMEYPRLDAEQVKFRPEHRIESYRFEMSKRAPAETENQPEPPVDVLIRRS